MLPALPETLSGATEFDLDVRLQAVARHGPDDGAEKPEPPGSNSPNCCTITPGGAAN
jgi:hypothetical protein